jgi:cysteine desulfurase
VLLAIGLSREQARSCLRLSIGRGTAEEDIDRFLAVLPGVVERLRALAPAER